MLARPRLQSALTGGRYRAALVGQQRTGHGGRHGPGLQPQWGPWRKAGYRSEGDATANGKGAVYWLEGSKRYGLPYPVSVEEILDVEPGQRLADTVLRGIPVRNYRAEVTLTRSPDGTPHPLGRIVGPDQHVAWLYVLASALLLGYAAAQIRGLAWPPIVTDALMPFAMAMPAEHVLD